MKLLTAPLKELGEYENIVNSLKKGKSVSLSGCTDSQKVNIACGLSSDFPVKIIATYSDLRAREIYEDLLLYDKSACLFPGKDLIFYQADLHGNEIEKERIRTLRKASENDELVIVTTFDSFMIPVVPYDVFSSFVFTVTKGKDINLKQMAANLVSMGYENNYQVEEAGQFSVRGGILDIFDLTAQFPVRIELWGDEVFSIRYFDIETQRSIEELDKIDIYPATEMILSGDRLKSGLEKLKEDASKAEEAFRRDFKTEEAHRIRQTVSEIDEEITNFLGVSGSLLVNLESYIRYFYPDACDFLSLMKGIRGEKENILVVLDEPSRIDDHVKAVELEFRESMIHRAGKGYALSGQMDLLISSRESYVKVFSGAVLALSVMEMTDKQFKWDRKCGISAKTVASYNNSFESLVKDLSAYKKKHYRIILVSQSLSRAKRMQEELGKLDIPASFTDDYEKEAEKGEIVCISGSLKRGFEYPQINFVVLSESDIFTEKHRKRRAKKSEYDGQKIRDFADLKVGDYVVHENHGLGIYRGIEKIEVDKVAKDYMKIEYGGGGVLYILATGLDLIQKYSGGEGARKPKLNRLGSGTAEWERTKSRVRNAVGLIADELVELYAKRQSVSGYAFGEDTVWQREFEELFPFEETRDQLNAIEETKKDMESSKAMDRLICGDVGFGKTEIAIRAAFKAVQENKQVAYLVPTTVLAQQHYNTFVQRMKDFPVRIDMLSRFRSPSEQKKTLRDLKSGMVDIVIGTHRILSKDVEFKDLGLLIVDEEQRFGVTHKEKIKQLKNDVDVLTLTATPIPRTLHMSLIGIRDMSLLEEAPEERLPIQTYVMDYNEEMVREAILREMSRHGQVYYVYNRVNSIADVTERLRGLVPEAEIDFAHGQMKESELEHIMFDFVNGSIDVLVSTTIIETGLDISNVNTIIIHDADQMGLAQLYQLRGRVGRSNRTSYAFLMYKRDKLLKEIAEKRLEAIREFTDLGSGYKIAMRDLEIRGAGNLLGEEQHGHMEAVGYDLYCKLLNEAVRKRKGTEVSESLFDTSVDLDVDAYIPPTYIVNEMQKLDIYKRIACVEIDEQAEDMREELKDRFGEVPREAENLLQISLLRAIAHHLFVSDIKGERGKITFTMYPKAPVKVERIPGFISFFEKSLSFETKGTPAFVLKYKREALVEKDEELLLFQTKRVLEEMKHLYD